jgi:hypothetical protein
MKNAEHYLTLGVSLAGHLAKICYSDPEEIVRIKSMETTIENISKLKTPHEDIDGQLFKRLNFFCMRSKKNWTKQIRSMRQLRDNSEYFKRA